MNLTLEILERIVEKPFSFIPERLSLNLPTYNGNFPFHPQQKKAIELCLSNSPLAVMAGISGSGKTKIIYTIADIAIANQKSVLIISPYESSLSNYKNLSLMPLEIRNDNEYRQLFKAWLKENFTNPNLNFSSNYFLPDSLFEKVAMNPQKWLDILDENDIKVLREKIEKEFSNTSKTRQLLLLKKIQQSRNLLEGKEYLRQSYQYLSNTALEELTTMAINSLKIPVICQEKYLNFLENKTFDLVIVEDSHNLEKETMEILANYSKKLVFFGEWLGNRENRFNQLFNSLSPAYRLEIKQNYRLNRQLAIKILPILYEEDSYRNFNRWNVNSFTGEKSCLIWHDVVNEEELLRVLQDTLSNFNHDYQLVTFSDNSRNLLQEKLANLGIYTYIKLIKECYGEEWENILIICDKNDSYQISQQDLHLALTRGKNQIIILGDKTHYEKSVFTDFFNKKAFYVIRDLTLI
jgi:Viral (Superfamily 1) RNA helicase